MQCIIIPDYAYGWPFILVRCRSVYSFKLTSLEWWRHQMETFSALLAICAGNSPVAGEFPAQRPVTRGFDVCFDLRLNKRVSKQSCSWLFETLPRLLWRHSNGYRGNHTIANEATLKNMGKTPNKFSHNFGKDSSITTTKKSDIKH